MKQDHLCHRRRVRERQRGRDGLSRLKVWVGTAIEPNELVIQVDDRRGA